MKKEEDSILKDVIGIIGAFLTAYGFFLICVLILMAVTQAAWLTYDTYWPDVLKFALIAPLVIMVLVAAWLITSSIHTERLLKTFVTTPAESPRMQEADKYLHALLSSDRLRARYYPKVREARTACFKDGRVISRKIRDYCQILYDIDPEYAEKNDFKDPRTDKGSANPASSCKAASAADSDAAVAAASGTSGASNGSWSGSTTSHSVYIPLSSSCEDDDSIALDMEEAIDDDIIFHGGNPFDWDTRSDYLDDPFGFGGDDGDGGEDW